MVPLSFIKMHGCGNDYVFIDCFTQPVPADPGKLSQTVSNRHCSVGSDGLVLMLPPAVADADATMRMFNADGSEGSLCGNALRCFAMWLHQSGRCGTDFCIEMAGRRIRCEVVQSDVADRSAIIRTAFGKPGELAPNRATAARLSPFAIPLELPDVSVEGQCGGTLHVSMGNPHTVFFVESLSEVSFDTLGPRIEHHVKFPHRTNVEFVEVTGENDCRVRVWERGSAETMACGSGACAVAVAGLSAGRFRPGKPISVQMSGGLLTISLDEDWNVSLQGPAAECCRGTLPPSAFTKQAENTLSDANSPN
ncbi:MAG: diaminopimelate epimerase [Planctomycetaceae bacterium]|nr:diaminopimelate epimerase [Planctomycetaceae bacterium]